MNDAFDRLLGQALAPEDRGPDWAFLTRVRAAVLLQERLAAERANMIGGVVRQLVALLAIAAAALFFGRSTEVADWVLTAPAASLGVLIIGFALFVALVTSEPRPLRMLNAS